MAAFIKRYLLPRLAQFCVVVFFGVSLVFLIPRLSPSDPVVEAITRLNSNGGTMDADSIKQLTESLRDLYGLNGTLLEQYGTFWNRLLHGDFGPSLAFYPSSCSSLIAESMPWTLGLLVISTLLSWALGTLLGGLAGFFYEKRWARTMELACLTMRPVPYYLMALGLVILFALVIPVFPLTGGYEVGTQVEWSWDFIMSVAYHGFLPALSLVLVGFGGWFLQMRSVTSSLVGEDYVTYSDMLGIPKRKILFNVVIRNALLPQVTGLALSLGGVFGGALITEQVFSYPGIGYLLVTAIKMSDYNLIMAISLLSILGVALSVLLVDILYPLFDPRVRLY
jgi:peptide/nickel transport system permease protein